MTFKLYAVWALHCNCYNIQKWIHDDVIKWKHFPRYWPFVTGEYPPVTRSFDVFFDVRLNKQLSKQCWGCWFETPSHPLWRHCNDYLLLPKYVAYSNHFIVQVMRCLSRAKTRCLPSSCKKNPQKNKHTKGPFEVLRSTGYISAPLFAWESK